MRSVRARISALIFVPLAVCASLAGAQDKPGIDLRQIEERNRAIQKKQEEDRRREAAHYAQVQESLRVQADSGACLARHRERGTCLLSAAEFNRFAGTVEPDGDMPAERISTVRRAMLKELLRGEFLSDRLAEAGLNEKVSEAGVAEEKKIWEDAAKNVGQRRLRDLYARYRPFFAAKEERTYEVLASTDSGLVDSLYRLASRSPVRDAAAKGTAGRDPLPWARVADSLLPASLAGAGAKLRLWRCSPPLRWGAGWAVVRPAQVNRIAAVSFNDALPGLIGLASYVPPDSARAAAAALAYFNDHPREFASADTLMLEARLDPGAESDSGVLRPAAPQRVSSAVLPADVRRWLRSLDGLRAGAVLGPKQMGLGWWSFRVLEAKPGKGARAFAQVRDSLAQRYQEGQAQAFMSHRTANLYRKRRDRGMRIFEELMDQRNPPTPQEIALALAADSSLSGLSPDVPAEKRREMQTHLAAFHVREKKRDEDFSAWLNRSIILSGI
jgi:hypothetical protein